MTPAESFYTAAFPEPVRCLGLPLKPFCLGHKILLHRFGSVFVTGEGVPSYDDLALSVFICHHTYEEALTAIAAADLDEVLADWERQLERPTWKHRLRMKEPNLIDLNGGATLFRDYVEAANKTPYYRYDVDKCGEIAAPIDQVLLSSLLENGMGFSEAVNMPLSLVFHLWLTQKAAAGHVNLIDKAAEEAAKETAKALHEKLVADGVIKEPAPVEGGTDAEA